MAQRTRPIPKNIFKERQLFRNLAEGIMETLILFVVLSLIPFTMKARWLFFISLAVFIMLINAFGVLGNSLIQAFNYKRKYRKLVKRTYHYRRFKDGVKRDKEQVVKNGKVVSIKNNKGYEYLKSIMGS